MSERAALKRRVRGLLHKKWLAPLLALILAVLPMCAAIALVTLLMKDITIGFSSIGSQLAGMYDESQEPLMAIFEMLYSNFQLDFSQVIEALPGMGVILGVFLLAVLPISVSTSGYFLAFLRGKKASPVEVYNCFSARYPRAFGGMLYTSLWALLWAVMAFAMPVALYAAGLRIIPMFVEQLKLSQLLVYGVLIAVCLIWFVVFTMLFINRLLAYSLAPVCLAAQPRMPAHRAVRLSRKLMRGCKWQLVGLYLSFLLYELPAILALAALIAMPHVAKLITLTDILQQSIGWFLWIVAGVNQLVLLYVAPYAAACFRAFYIERKREALMDEEVTPDDFTGKDKKETRRQAEKEAEAAKAEENEAVRKQRRADREKKTGNEAATTMEKSENERNAR